MIYKKWPAEKSDKWHLWFAWFPVEVEKGVMVWLQTIMRRNIEGSLIDYWEYSLIKKS